MRKNSLPKYRSTTINLPRETFDKLTALKSGVTNHVGLSKAIYRTVELIHGLVTPGSPDYCPVTAKRYANMTPDLGKRRRRKN